MKKSISLILITLLLITFTACGKKEKKESEQPTPEPNEEVRKLISNTDKQNYAFEYTITAEEQVQKFKGRMYNGLEAGVYTENIVGTTYNTSYQIQDEECYDPESKSPILSVYFYASTDYILLSNIEKILNSKQVTCNLNGSTYNCQNNDDETYDISFSGDYVTKIFISTGNDVTYEMNYSNINNVDPIEKIA